MLRAVTVISHSLVPTFVLGNVAKRQYDHINSYSEKHLIGAALEFGGLAQYHYDREHTFMQTDVVLEKYLHLIPQAAGKDAWLGLSIGDLKAHLSFNFTNKATHTPTRPHL